jgi:Tol biopolymer transport system component
VKRLKLGVCGLVIILMLIACQQSVLPNQTQATALFFDEDLDKAQLEVGPVSDIGGTDLGEIADGEVTTLPDYKAETLSPAAVLPGASGFIYYFVNDTSAADQWKIYRFNQSTDTNTLVYQGQRALNSVAGNASGTIVYFSARQTTSATSDFEIYKLNVNSSAVTRLTNNTTDDINVSSSADGNRVAFEGLGTTGQKAVYYRIYSTSTSFVEQRLASTFDQFEPSISGNGNYIAFIRLLSTGSYRIMLYSISANTYLSVQTEALTLNHPSPDDTGNKVAWLRNTTSGYEVRVKNLSTTAITTAVTNTTVIRHPHLTRDGNFITYGRRVSNSFNVFSKNLTSGATIRGTSFVVPVNADGMYWQTPSVTATIRGKITRGTAPSIVANQEATVYAYNYSQSAKQSRVDDLVEQATTQGRVRVILTLGVGFRPEGTLSPATATSQRQDIQQMQTSLLQRYSTQVSRITRFETVPLVAMEVDATTLQALRNDPSVIWIEEDIPVPPTLAESTGVIGMPAAWSAGFSGSGQAVAILDTGVDRTHSFFGGRVVSEACYSTSSTTVDYTSTKACPGGTRLLAQIKMTSVRSCKYQR